MATAARHTDRADALRALVEETRATKCSLVHCDVSPKNILAGAAVPVLSRCRMAWWVHPARDCLLACFDALEAAYADNIDWESASVCRSAPDYCCVACFRPKSARPGKTVRCVSSLTPPR